MEKIFGSHLLHRDLGRSLRHAQIPAQCLPSIH
jgi:hypothetical protein